VASDAHDAKYRPPSLKEAHEYVSKACGERRAAALFMRNPAAALSGSPIEIDLEPPSPAKKWYQFRRHSQ
jgi:tyrosine-protein phosphatase YwqE